MGDRDHHPFAGEASLPKAGDELNPEGLALALAQLEAQQLAEAFHVHMPGVNYLRCARLRSFPRAALGSTSPPGAAAVSGERWC